MSVPEGIDPEAWERQVTGAVTALRVDLAALVVTLLIGSVLIRQDQINPITFLVSTAFLFGLREWLFLKSIKAAIREMRT